MNGETVPILRVFDTWMAVPLSEGKTPFLCATSRPDFSAGAWLSAAGFGVTLLAGWLLCRKGVRIRPLEKPAGILLSLLTAGVFAAVYLMPVAVYLIYQLSAV